MERRQHLDLHRRDARQFEDQKRAEELEKKRLKDVEEKITKLIVNDRDCKQYTLDYFISGGTGDTSTCYQVLLSPCSIKKCHGQS